MLKKAAINLSNYFIKKQMIDSEDKEMYNYCFEIMLSTIINAIAILIIGMSTALYAETFMFAFNFVLFRGVCGGAHAKTHLMCFATLMIVFAGFVILELLVAYYILQYISIAMSVVSIMIILVFCPIDNVNKPIDKKEKKKLRRKMYVCVIGILLVAIPLHCFQSLTNYSFAISYPLFSVSCSMLIGAIINKSYRKNSINIINNCENLPKST